MGGPEVNAVRLEGINADGDHRFGVGHSYVSNDGLIPEGLISRVADRLALLGLPVRLRIIEELLIGSSTPQELADKLGLSQQHVSKNLRALAKEGIVHGRREGINVVYTLVDEHAADVLSAALESVMTQLRGLSALASGQDRPREGDAGSPTGAERRLRPAG